MKGTNKRSGISLIVLVITIIVIIILAVAVILTLSQNNPIENAKKAVSANDEATLKEEATLLYADWYLLKNVGEGTDLTAQEYVEAYLSDGYKPELKAKLHVSDEGEITIGGESAIAKKWNWTDNQEEGTEGHGEISVGDLITHKEKTNEKFYVIKVDVDGDNVAMLAAKNITTTGTLVQSDDAPTIVFSNICYWLSEISYPLDLNEYTDKTDEEKTNMGVVSTDAIEIARAYGATFGVTGRLMTVEEIEDLDGSMDDGSTSACPSFINSTDYWLGSTSSDYCVWFVNGKAGELTVCDFDVDSVFGVRPVLEISASSISIE